MDLSIFTLFIIYVLLQNSK